MTNKIFALTANEENLQALVFEELDDSQASAVVGGGSVVDGAQGTAISVGDTSRDAGNAIVGGIKNIVASLV